jgi:hypothetical protein
MYFLKKERKKERKKGDINITLCKISYINPVEISEFVFFMQEWKIYGRF